VQKRCDAAIGDKHPVEVLPLPSQQRAPLIRSRAQRACLRRIARADATKVLDGVKTHVYARALDGGAMRNATSDGRLRTFARGLPCRSFARMDSCVSPTLADGENLKAVSELVRHAYAQISCGEYHKACRDKRAQALHCSRTNWKPDAGMWREDRTYSEVIGYKIAAGK
jgi:hypothetical protein